MKYCTYYLTAPLCLVFFLLLSPAGGLAQNTARTSAPVIGTSSATSPQSRTPAVQTSAQSNRGSQAVMDKTREGAAIVQGAGSGQAAAAQAGTDQASTDRAETGQAPSGHITSSEITSGQSDSDQAVPPRSGVITITPKTALRSAGQAPGTNGEGEDGTPSITSWSATATKALVRYEESQQPRKSTGAPELRPLQQ